MYIVLCLYKLSNIQFHYRQIKNGLEIIINKNNRNYTKLTIFYLIKNVTKLNCIIFEQIFLSL